MIRAYGSQNARWDSGRIKIRPYNMIRAYGSQGMRLKKVSTIIDHYLKHATVFDQVPLISEFLVPILTPGYSLLVIGNSVLDIGYCILVSGFKFHPESFPVFRACPPQEDCWQSPPSCWTSLHKCLIRLMGGKYGMYGRVSKAC